MAGGTIETVAIIAVVGTFATLFIVWMAQADELVRIQRRLNAEREAHGDVARIPEELRRASGIRKGEVPRKADAPVQVMCRTHDGAVK